MSEDRPSARRGASTTFRVVQAVFVAAVVLFLGRYLRHAWPAVHAYQWRLRPGLLAVSAALVLCFYLLNALAWWLILRGSGLRPAPTRTVATWAKSILARYVPGNVFMFVSRGWMSYRQGLDVDRVSAGMVYEQVLAVAGALVITAALFPFWHYERRVTAWALLAIPLIVVALHPRVFAPLVRAAAAGAAPAAAHPGAVVSRGARPARPVHRPVARGRPRDVDVRGGGHERDRRRLPRDHRGIRGGVRGRHGRVLRAQRHRRARGACWPPPRPVCSPAAAWRWPGHCSRRLWQTALELGFVAVAALADRLQRRARGRAAAMETGAEEQARRASKPRQDGEGT